LVMPMFSSDLRHAIDDEMKSTCGSGAAPFSDMVGFSIIVQLALGMKSLHDSGIYHRDLKADNVLVTKSPPLGEVDFNCFYMCHIADFENSEEVWGTGFWRAPEVLSSLETGCSLGKNEWQAADVYSFGMTCYEVLTGEVPFHGHLSDDYDIVLDGGRPSFPDFVPEPLKNIVQRCWHQDPSSRPDFGHIIEALKEVDEYGYFDAWLDAINILQPMWDSISGAPSELESRLMPLQELMRLQELVEKHYAVNYEAKAGHLNYAFWGPKFVATVNQFVSEFGWDSYITHPTLPFGLYVRRKTLAVLLSQHFGGLVNNVDVSFYSQQAFKDWPTWPTFPSEKLEMVVLARNLYNEIEIGNEQSRFEDNDGDLTLKEKLKILDGFVMDIKDVLDEASALGSVEVILGRMDPAGRSTEIARFHHHMRFMIRRRTFIWSYGVPLRALIGCMVLYLMYNSSFCNYVLFQVFGIMLSDFYGVFLGFFCPILKFQVIGRLQAGIPIYSQYFLLLRYFFSIVTFFFLVKSYGFLRYLSWLLVSFCVGSCVEIVFIFLLTLHEYLFRVLVPVIACFGNRARIKEE
jgi:serine/threonine protein kinase